jgi:type II secretory ATPase GspE/PulE/Tfp pilus assembly ATPase PilB-like protein
MVTSTFQQDTQFQSDGDLEQVVLFDDKENVILISKDHVFQAHVRSAVQRIKSSHKDSPITERHVGMDEIAKRRLDGVGQKAENVIDKTEMQQHAAALFLRAVKMKASDIHIRVSERGRCQVLFRIHNDLTQIEQHPYTWAHALCTTIYHSMADVSDATFEEGSRQDARIGNKNKLPQGLDGIRIATTPMVDGFVMVLRMLYDASGASNDLRELGYNANQTARIAFLKRRPTGLNLVAGPTGSGKSTTLQRTLASLIEETEGTRHVITVEDPPEYPIPGAVQTPVTNAPTEELRAAAFQQAIKGAMRVDPDIIMIGEIRDTPSARLAFQAAMTGHQVWSTLHANGAFHTVDRLVDLGVSLELMTDPAILSGMICQRLLKTLCTCKRPFKSMFDHYKEHRPNFDEDLNRITSILDIDDLYAQGPGCDACNQTGILGRTVVAEVVVTDNTMMGLIKVGKLNDAIEYWKREHKGITMVEHAILKAQKGLVDPLLSESIVGPLDGGKSFLQSAALPKA